MQFAKSARINAILGASLAAMIVPGVTSAEVVVNRMMAIDSSSALGIDSSSALAIDSSSGLAIDSSSGFAIDSSSALAIDSSSGLAIDSSSARAIDSSSGFAIDSSSIILAGPIESIDRDIGIFVSLGQSVTIPSSGFGAHQVGEFVMVSGVVSRAGWIDADFVSASDQRYIPGATEILVTGIPSSVNYELGIARIGNLPVDYTPSLGGSDFEGIGAAITVIGIQPALGGIMISDRVLDRTDLFLRD